MKISLRSVTPRQPAWLLAILLIPSNSLAEMRTVSVAIDVSKTGAPISKYLYGQFSGAYWQHHQRGRLAEMLEDRKF